MVKHRSRLSMHPDCVLAWWAPEARLGLVCVCIDDVSTRYQHHAGLSVEEGKGPPIDWVSSNSPGAREFPAKIAGWSGYQIGFMQPLLFRLQ